MVPETARVSVSNITKVLSPTRPTAGAAKAADKDKVKAVVEKAAMRSMVITLYLVCKSTAPIAVLVLKTREVRKWMQKF
jgi:hypothetical protein